MSLIRRGKVTPESAGWSYVGFEVVTGTVERDTGDRELCVVVLAGTCKVQSRFGDWQLRGRPDPFSALADAAYLPPATRVTLTGGELALCWAPALSGATPRVLRGRDVAVETRGRGHHQRYIRPILMGDQQADALLVCEVITPAGHWSSYPPHKHDRDALPEESLLEETYYHRLSPSHGFAFQRVYGDGLDETVTVHDGDVVLVPRGYHTVATPPGYDLYYLNVMAGPSRVWAVANDPDHERTLRP